MAGRHVEKAQMLNVLRYREKKPVLISVSPASLNPA